MNKEAVNDIGQGRVWTGYDAKSIGLIDTYGGIEKAIEIAAELADVQEYRIISLPKKKDPFTELALKLEGKTNISQIILEKLGFETPLVNPAVEELIREDKIQARIPFIMELK